MKRLIILLLPVILCGCETLQYAADNPETVQIDPYRGWKSFEERYFRYEIPDPPGTLPPEYIYKRDKCIRQGRCYRYEEGWCVIPADAPCRKKRSCTCRD